MMFSKETLVEYHLTHNIFPPLSLELVPYAIEALGLASDGFYDHDVVVNGYTLRDAITGNSITAGQVIDSLKMHDLVERQEIV
jgi:hypothetical protein